MSNKWTLKSCKLEKIYIKF